LLVFNNTFSQYYWHIAICVLGKKRNISDANEQKCHKMKMIYALLCTLVLVSCRSTVPFNKTATENILSVSFDYDKQEFKITVVSNGCTVKEDFNIQQDRNQITVVRRKNDDCKAMPQALSINWSFKEAGIDPDLTYSIQNLFIANPNIANIRSNEK
jgi:hypothetical protein